MWSLKSIVYTPTTTDSSLPTIDNIKYFSLLKTGNSLPNGGTLRKTHIDVINVYPQITNNECNFLFKQHRFYGCYLSLENNKFHNLLNGMPSEYQTFNKMVDPPKNWTYILFSNLNDTLYFTEDLNGTLVNDKILKEFPPVRVNKNYIPQAFTDELYYLVRKLIIEKFNNEIIKEDSTSDNVHNTLTYTIKYTDNYYENEKPGANDSF